MPNWVCGCDRDKMPGFLTAPGTPKPFLAVLLKSGSHAKIARKLSKFRVQMALAVTKV
jgi:hypothetical protein